MTGIPRRTRRRTGAATQRARPARGGTARAVPVEVPTRREPDTARSEHDARERWIAETLTRAPDVPTSVRVRIAQILSGAGP